MNTLLFRISSLLAALLLSAAVPARGEGREPVAPDPAPAPSEDSAPLAPPRHFGTDFLERSSLLTHHGNRGDFRRRMLSRGLSEDEALDLLREIVVSLRSPGETDGDWRRRYALTRAVSAVGAFGYLDTPKYGPGHSARPELVVSTLLALADRKMGAL